MSQTTTHSGAACAHNWLDSSRYPGCVRCSICAMVSEYGREGKPHVSGSSASAEIIPKISALLDIAENEAQTVTFENGLEARAAVATLIARNAELEASLSERNADYKTVLEHGVALAAENKVLRTDAERWQEVSRRFDGSKTSAACLTLEGLGLEPTPYRSFAENVDAAIARAPANGDAS